MATTEPTVQIADRLIVDAVDGLIDGLIENAANGIGERAEQLRILRADYQKRIADHEERIASSRAEIASIEPEIHALEMAETRIRGLMQQWQD